jgi:glycosyltransferase involved in cell wall biosynthesis
MRVLICQPLIPAYRLPLYERLGTLPGIELTVYAGGSQGSLRAFHQGHSFNVKTAPVRHWRLGFRVQFAQLTAATRRKVDLIILPWDVHFLTVFPSVALAHLTGVPVVLWGHGYSLDPHPLTDAVRNSCGKMADGVLLYTQSVASQLIKDYGFRSERVFVAQNAIDQAPIHAARQRWSRCEQELADFQVAHGIDPTKTLLFISRLEKTNRVDMLLHATAVLKNDFPSIKTLIVGEGSQRAQLQDLSRSLGIERHVIFTGAIYDEMQVAPWMMSATLFCYPVNVGLSLLHAFGYGLPAVTSDDRRAQNPEIEAFVPNENGLEFRKGEITHLVEQCARILGNSELRSVLSASAIRTARQRYSLDQMVAGFQRVFSWAARPDRAKKAQIDESG